MSVLIINPYRFAVGFASITDSFDRADSTTTMGNADSGQTWVPVGGTWGIASNLAYEYWGTSQAITGFDTTIADCTIQATMTVGGNAGLCWRYTDADNHFTVAANLGWAYKLVAGGFTLLGSTSAWSDGDTMTVIIAGDSHTIKKNGTTVISYTDSFQQTVTKHGIRCHASNAPRFNDFSIVP